MTVSEQPGHRWVAGDAHGRPDQPGDHPGAVQRAHRWQLPRDLGIEVVRIEDDEVEGRLSIDERHLHPGGYVHGGVWVAFADTVAAWGTYRHLPAGHDFTTAELKANVFAAGHPGDVLHASGPPAAPRAPHSGLGGAHPRNDEPQRGLLQLHPDGGPASASACAGEAAALVLERLELRPQQMVLGLQRARGRARLVGRLLRLLCAPPARA